MASTRTIPLFPLGTVLYPTAVLPLHIFEERYRDLVGDLSEQPAGAREFGIVAIREGHEVGVDAATALYDVGTIASLRGIDPLPDGAFDIVTLGTERFRILAVQDGHSYLMATIEIVDDADPTTATVDSSEVLALRNELVRLSRVYRQHVHVPSAPAIVADDPIELTWEIADSVILDLAERQRVLSSDSLVARMRLLRSLLKRECTLLETLGAFPAMDVSGNPFSVN